MKEPTPWPTLPLLSQGQIEYLAAQDPAGWQATVVDFYVKREEAIRLEVADPLRYGWEGSHWKDARRLFAEKKDVLILGGNRSGKTTFAAKVVVEELLRAPGRQIWCFMEDEVASIDRQQEPVYKHLPPELRMVGKKGRTTKISYTRANGFSDRVFVLPNGSVCRFMTYAAYRNNPGTVEGGELDLCWCDELVPLPLVKTLRFRLATRNGKLISTFTPIEGFSPTVAEYLEGATVAEARPAELAPEARVAGCKQGWVPYVMQPRDARWAVIFFHSELNPYGGYSNVAAEVRNRPLSERLMRAYGFPTKQIANAFPKFSKVNVVPRSAIPAEGSNYMVVDPAGARNWFMVWLRADAMGRVFVYREWPDSTLGEWAEPGDKPDGKAGPAQRVVGPWGGIAGYKRLIRDLEGAGRDDAAKPEDVLERIIDPRAGNTQIPGAEDGTSIVDLMAQEQVDRDGAVVAEPMLFRPAPASKVDEGAALINDWLDYNPEEPLSEINRPRLFVAEDCRNVIYALQTWTGADGEKGATKDPIDCLKYAAKWGVEFVPEHAMTATGDVEGY